MKKTKIRIGTRSSELAIWQAEFLKGKVEDAFPEIECELKRIKTKGDKIQDVALSKIGGKGLFTKEIENELLAGTVSLAAHSLKDLPTELPAGLEIAAILERHDPRDALISEKKGLTIETLAKGGTVATGSLRRRAQLSHLRPDLAIVDLRGNVNTRIRKYLESDWEAIVLAKAGVERIKLTKHVSSYLDPKEFLPAVGQGAVAVEIRTDDAEVRAICEEINHAETQIVVAAERAFLKALGGGCQTPIAANAKLVDGRVELDGLVATPDGEKFFRDTISGVPANSEALGRELAEILMSRGADKILKF